MNLLTNATVVRSAFVTVYTCVTNVHVTAFIFVFSTYVHNNLCIFATLIVFITSAGQYVTGFAKMCIVHTRI